MLDNVRMEIIKDEKVVAVELEYLGEIAHGHSICHEEDSFDPGVGITLATGRAFSNLGSALKRRANKRMQ